MSDESIEKRKQTNVKTRVDSGKVGQFHSKGCRYGTVRPTSVILTSLESSRRPLSNSINYMVLAVIVPAAEV